MSLPNFENHLFIVLIVRAEKGKPFTDADLAKGLECNNSINVHWGGKGAYAVLTDLVAALSGGDPDDNVVRYTMLYERDLALSPAIGADKAKEILATFKA